MVKNLRFIFASLLMLLCGTVSAQTVFDFDANGVTLLGLPGESDSNGSTDGDITKSKTATIGDYSITVSAAAEGAKDPNRLWNASPKLRMYSGTLTIESSKDNMKSILFTLHNQSSKAKWGATNTVDVGSIDATAKTSATWTGDAKKVIITIGSNTQIKSITISSEGGQVTPPEIQEVNVAKALEIINGLADGATTTDEYKVKGFVVGAPEFQRNKDTNKLFGNVNLNIADAKNGTPTLTIYRAKYFNGSDFTENDLESIKDGDEVVFQGQLQKFVKDGTTTPEMATGGVLISVNGQTEAEVTVEKAANISAFKALAENTVAELTLTNAKVLYKNVNGENTELFIRDASGAMDLYNMGIKASAGQVLNGTIIGTRGANNGFTIAMKSHAKTNVATVTVSGTEGDVDAEEIGFDEAASYYCDYVVLKNVNVSEDKKNAVNEDEETLPLYDRFKLSLLNNLKTDVKYDIYGLMYDGGETYGAELVVTKVTLAGGGEIVDDPATPVASIAALLDMENTNNIELTLTDAKVLFVDNNYIYVRENGKAVCFYQISGLKEAAKNNSIINGKIQVDYEVYKLLPEVKNNKNTNLDGLTITESEEAALPVETTLAKVANGDNVCDLVTLKATKLHETSTGGSNTYYLQDGDVKIVCANNGKGLEKIEDGTEITVVGIVNTNNNAYQIKLTKTVDTQGISTVAADNGKVTIFNLAGQRMEKAVKGLYIVNGKKVMIK